MILSFNIKGRDVLKHEIVERLDCLVSDSRASHEQPWFLASRCLSQAINHTFEVIKLKILTFNCWIVSLFFFSCSVVTKTNLILTSIK